MSVGVKEFSRLDGAVDSAAEPMVRMRGITKIFPVRKRWRDMVLHPLARETVTVVNHVTIDIAQGEFFGLLGPNGAGKSTLFKILATLILADEGEASVGGLDVSGDSPGVRDLLTPVVPDERSLYWRLSATDNLRLFAALQGLKGRVADDRVGSVLEVVGLVTADKMVGQFSSGMKQRLLLARALLAEPKVLLLDEPTRSLDPISARDFRAFLKEEIAGRQGRTVLLATHNAEEALELCDRLAVLHQGTLLATGTVEELRRQVGDDRYRALVRAPHGRAVAGMDGLLGVHDVEVAEGEEAGWEEVDFKIPGGAERAAGVLSWMVEQGIPVARFEPVELTLADLLQRIVDRPPSEAP